MTVSKTKKLIRDKFRELVLQRDKHKCVFCNRTDDLDAHHITDRNLMPNGGYVKENGITLCPFHHRLAEVYHSTGEAHEGMSPEHLYAEIKSNFRKAYHASSNLRY